LNEVLQELLALRRYERTNMDDKLPVIALTLVIATAMTNSVVAQTKSTAPSTNVSATTSAPSTNTLSPGQSNVIGKTADAYTPFAGSRSNAENLAIGLRTGSEITLSSSGVPTPHSGSTTFTPPTKPMGYGNVNKSLALSSQQLAAAGVAQPTPEQIKTSLMGGTIRNDAGQRVTMQGVLQMRADGMGWGQIAHQIGVKPGQGYRPAYTASGITTASGKTGVVTTKGKQTSTTTAGTGIRPNTIGGSQSSRSGIVTASGAMATGGNHASGTGSAHRVPTTGSGTGSQTSGVVSAAGRPSTGGQSGGGLAKGHAK
jgi:hypothetical protein